ncbi:MAG: TetR/AcrR family transcriptional regulator [Beijerinckiaceae bacterium]
MSHTAPAREKDQRCRIIETAEQLFRQLGFQKTTVSDIARELHMSPANVYRFFGTKSEINEAVARQIMGEIEAAAEKIASGPGTAAERLRQVIKTNEAMSAERYIADRKLHDMVDVALTEKWPIIDAHVERMGGILTRIIAEGMDAGEFARHDPLLVARIVHCACIRFCHPRLMVECCNYTEPSSDQMMDFCLAALKAGM